MPRSFEDMSVRVFCKYPSKVLTQDWRLFFIFCFHILFFAFIYCHYRECNTYSCITVLIYLQHNNICNTVNLWITPREFRLFFMSIIALRKIINFLILYFIESLMTLYFKLPHTYFSIYWTLKYIWLFFCMYIHRTFLLL